jgi:hypothetical protein
MEVEIEENREVGFEKRSTYAIRVLVSPSIKAIVGGVETTLWEPDNISVFEPTGSDGLEWSIPVKEFEGGL